MFDCSYIHALRKAIFSKSRTDPSEHHFCRKISIDIFYSTDEYLSESTIKRLFGVLVVNESPSQKVLGILVRYLGFENWVDFAKGVQDNEPVIDLKTS